VQRYVYFCRTYIKDDQLPPTVIVVVVAAVSSISMGASRGDCSLGTPSTWNFRRKSELHKIKKYNILIIKNEVFKNFSSDQITLG
jgi:hypothetical protein